MTDKLLKEDGFHLLQESSFFILLNLSLITFKPIISLINSIKPKIGSSSNKIKVKLVNSLKPKIK